MRWGAPQTLQVADRFHLRKHATDALEQVLIRQHRFLRLAAKDEQPRLGAQNAGTTPTIGATSISCALLPQGTRMQREQAARLARQRARCEQIPAPQAQGLSYRAHARRVGLSWETVTRLARADAPPEWRHQQ